MRPTLSRAPGLLLSLALAIAPGMAWAAPSPVRANLGQSQSTVTEERWQPIPSSETVTGPWQLVGSTTWVDRKQLAPMLLSFQEYRTDSYRQRTTTYPLEGREQRSRTTTTQNYELRTYVEHSTSSTVLVPVTREVGAWVTSTIDKPVTVPIQEQVLMPTLITQTLPIYRTVTSTRSAPLYRTLEYRTTVAEPRVETVTKYRAEVTTATETAYYNGSARANDIVGSVNVSADGRSYVVKGLTPFNAFGTYLTPPPEGVTVKDGQASYISKEASHTSTVTWFCTVIEMPDGRDMINVVTHYSIRYANGGSGGGSSFGQIRLDGKFKGTRTVTSTRQVPYTTTQTVNDFRPVAVPFTVQLETLANAPSDRAGAPVSEGVFWKHYHQANVPCPYKVVSAKWVAGMRDFTELDVALKGPLVGKAAQRIEALEDSARASFRIAHHHTDVWPRFADDVRAESYSEDVIDRHETRQVWVQKPTFVTKQIPVRTVVRWLPLKQGSAYTHTHSDPLIRCENKYLTTTTAARSQPGRTTVGRNTRSTYGYGAGPGGAVDGNTGALTISHTMQPEFGPLVEKVSSTAWATRSVTVMEPRTVTSTYSVLVSTVPGQDISTSYSPWLSTGEQRRVGDGKVQDATRSVIAATGRKWTQDLAPAQTMTPLRAQSATFASDRSNGGASQTISGSALRLRLKATEALGSKAKLAQTGGAISIEMDETRPQHRRDTSAASRGKRDEPYHLDSYERKTRTQLEQVTDQKPKRNSKKDKEKDKGGK